MTVLEWDMVGERYYQTGVDKGVLYPNGGLAVPWNGLTSVDVGSDVELQSYYLDGVKILNHVTPGNFVGKLNAITYPDEFDRLVGAASPLDGEGAAVAGLTYHDQTYKSFNLSYRTRKGNDVDGIDFGYRIHLLYNMVAIPDTSTYETVNESLQPSEFSWTLNGVPQFTPGYKPTSHISIDSTTTPTAVLSSIEDLLYGTDAAPPHFPSINEVAAIFGAIGALIIIDNGDGTWTAVDDTDSYITMFDPTTFSIDFADVEYLNEFTYEISSTNVD